MSPAALLEKGLESLDALGVMGPGADLDFELDGQALGECPVLRPGDGEALGQVLGILSEHRMAALVRGGGSRLDLGNPPGPIDVVLEMSSLSGVSDFEREDGVVHVDAGTPLADLREQVGAEGWVLRLDPPGAAATVGGTLAASAVGPQVLGFGRPRDCVLGLDVVLASGERTSCGGRVVKNVTGYDMAKLYTGSFGTLGVIAGAWLRLAPIPELEQILIVSSPNFENLFAISLEASRRSTARASALLSPAAARRGELSPVASVDHWVGVLELAGDAIATRCDADWLADCARRDGLQLVESQPGAIERVRAMQGEIFEPGGVRARVAALPSALPALARELADVCAGLILHPGVGLVYGFSQGGREAAIATIDACTRAAATVGGSLVLEALPAADKVGRDVFGEIGSELALMRVLKQRFDPTAVLNPGRFAGGI